MSEAIPFLLLLGLAGCASGPARQTLFTARHAAGASVVLPRLFTCVWTPGDYTNFVVVSSPVLTVPVRQWPTWLETQQTNFQFSADEPQRFFTLYGTNKVTGENAWAGK